MVVEIVLSPKEVEWAVAQYVEKKMATNFAAPVAVTLKVETHSLKQSLFSATVTGRVGDVS